jgi:enterochelin esterase-like enzyme
MTHMHPFRNILILSLLLGASACTSSVQPTPTGIPSTPTAAIPSPTPLPTIVPTATPLTCLTQPGRVESGSIDTTRPPQEFLIYLPPCYDAQVTERYPVLYLLHGQLQTDDFWVVHLGAPAIADRLIHSGAAQPFIMVFPDDRYWNQPAASGFGDRVIDLVIPLIDLKYRTLTDRGHRAVGGLSLGGGWAIHLGLTRYDLFGTIGLHSPAIQPEDEPYLEHWIKAVPPDSWPRFWIDAGDADKDLGSITSFESLLTSYDLTHDWHLFTGDHSETYWRAHTPRYLQWYADGWNVQAGAAPDPTPGP